MQQGISHTHHEPHGENMHSKLNWLRASVLGANDGIVSTAGLVVGVASATDSLQVIIAAGLAGIIAGAISMAAGEYVSVSSSRDSERALLKKEKQELENFPEEELEELALLYQRKGLSPETAQKVAKELSAKDAFAAHADAELRMNPNDLTNPWHAAFASAASFTIGALIPLFTIVFAPADIRIPFTFASIIVALIITGTMSAKVGKAKVSRAVIRVVVGGALAMLITYTVGSMFGIKGV